MGRMKIYNICHNVRIKNSLINVDMIENNIGSEGAKMINEALTGNRSLTELHLHCFVIQNKNKKKKYIYI